MKYHKMRQIMNLLLICLILIFCLGCAQNRQSVSDRYIQIQDLRQLVTADNQHARLLLWRGAASQNYVVEYRLHDSSFSEQVKAEAAPFKDGDWSYYQYRALLQGLQAGSTYEYRIKSDDRIGQWHKLQTAADNKVTALIFPDSQSSDYAGWGRLANNAYKQNPQADLYVNMGDLVDNGQDSRQWESWLSQVSTFSSELPLAPVIGNHETYTLDWKLRYPESYIKLFEVPAAGSEKYPGQFYSFDYGNVHFTVLDTNFQEMQALQPQLLADELKWLEQDLAGSKALWKVVLMHKDIMLYGFTNRPGTTEHFTDAGTALMPVFEKYRVDLVLSAHLHTYRRRVPLKNFQPDSDGLVYILTGVAGSVRYADLWKNSALDAAKAPQPETDNYLTLEANDRELICRAFLSDGSKFDEVHITKK